MKSVLLGVGFLLAALGAQAAPRWNDILRQPAAWYQTAEAGGLADNVLLFQTESGGWPKNVDMTSPPSADFLASTAFDHRHATIDNNATTTQIRFLALVSGASPQAERYRDAAQRGLIYLLESQYDSGGWPQYFPLIAGYYTHLTYNDDAMTNVLNLLRDVSKGVAPYSFAADEVRTRAGAAVERGVRCILRTQVKQDEHLTGWCAQHDEKSFEPAWARNFEPPSLSGNETVGIVRFLMGEPPTPEIRAAIEGAVVWLRSSAIAHLRVENFTAADGKKDRRAVIDPAAPPIWARFYELKTNRPLYLGRDRVIRYDFNQIERERRTGYTYLGTWPERLLSEDYPRWTAQLPTSRSQ